MQYWIGEAESAEHEEREFFSIELLAFDDGLGFLMPEGAVITNNRVVYKEKLYRIVYITNAEDAVENMTQFSRYVLQIPPEETMPVAPYPELVLQEMGWQDEE